MSSTAGLPQRWALLIAIDIYQQSSNLPDSDHNKEGARKLRDVLVDSFRIRPENIHELYDSDATADHIMETVQNLSQIIHEHDSLLIVFCGQTTDKAWYPWDTEKESDAIPHFIIRGWCRQIQANNVLFITERPFQDNLAAPATMISNSSGKSREVISFCPEEAMMAQEATNPFPTFAHLLASTLNASAASGKKPGSFEVVQELRADDYDPVHHQRLQDCGDEGGEYSFFIHKLPSMASSIIVPDELAADDPDDEYRRRSQEELEKLTHQAKMRFKYITEHMVRAPIKERREAWQDYLRQFRSTGYQVEYAEKSLKFIENQEALNPERLEAMDVKDDIRPWNRRGVYSKGGEDESSSAPAGRVVLKVFAGVLGILILGAGATFAYLLISEIENTESAGGQPQAAAARAPAELDRAARITERIIAIAEEESARNAILELKNRPRLNRQAPITVDLSGEQIRFIPVYTTNSPNLARFWMAETEITQAQWERIMDSNPSPIKGGQYPVSNITFAEAEEFCERLSDQIGRWVRMPLKEEWLTASALGVDSAPRQLEAWFATNSNGRIQRVKEKAPNSVGLYDMFGNVRELTQSDFEDSPGIKVTMGGGFESNVQELQQSSMLVDGLRAEDTGFRPVLDPEE